MSTILPVIPARTPARRSTVFFCAVILLGLLAAPAFADVVKCRDAVGEITYSNQSCGDGAHQVVEAAAVTTERWAPTESTIAHEAQRVSPWATRPVAVKKVSSDAETIGQAHRVMLANDEIRVAMSQVKRQRLSMQ